MDSKGGARHPRFWLFISLLLLNQLIAPAIASRNWEKFGKNNLESEKRRTTGQETRLNIPSDVQETRLDIPSDVQELIDFAKSNASAAILDDEQTGMFTGLCHLEHRPCPNTPTLYGKWTSLGKGLFELLKIGGIISAATCLSLSFVSIITCGGLRPDTCRKYREVQSSMKGLKEMSTKAIDENAELRRWNSSNLDIIYKLGAIQVEIETIVEDNALLMDALGVLRYNSTPTDMDPAAKPDASKDEYDELLNKTKLAIETDMQGYIKSLEDRIKGLTGAQSIAFAAFAGISLMIQLAPSFLRGVRRLQLGSVKLENLVVEVGSSTSGVRMAVNMKTGNKYFVKVSDGAVSKVLGKVGTDGGSMGGFFDMFASPKTKQKINDFLTNEKIAISKDRIAASKIKGSQSSLDKLADWTKDMDGQSLDDYLGRVKADGKGADSFVSKSANKPAVIKAPPAAGGIMSKLTAKFKPVGKFFCKVKTAIKDVAHSFSKTKVWKGLKKYGFDALGAIMSAAAIGMCVHQVISTVKGANEMNTKLDETRGNITRTKKDLTEARKNVATIVGLQKGLFKNLTRDSTKMLKFFVNDTSTADDQGSLSKFKERVAKETPKFKDLLDKISSIGPLDNRASSEKLRGHLDAFQKLLSNMRRSLIGIYRKVKMSILIKNSVRSEIPVASILRNLKDAGFDAKGTFEIVNDIARSHGEKEEYDNYPLNCIRKGVIKNQSQLDEYMKSSGTKVVSENVKNTIKTAADFWQAHVTGDPRSIVMLLTMKGLKCGSADCTASDVLTVIAKIHPDWKDYDGYLLDDYRNQKAVC